MDLTTDGVLALAPDSAAAAAGRKLASPNHWQNLGRSDAALWGECRGSALYHVRVDLGDFTAACSCPSRKFPCKHGLGLLLIASDALGALPVAAPPAWVVEWLAKRGAAAEKREARRSTPTPALAPDAATARRVEKRLTLVRQGMDGLDLWMNDLLRNGLAGLEAQPATFWEKQAARLVDAQAPALAGRVRRLAAIPGSGPDWPRRLLDALGRVALLTQAFRRIETLDPPLQADLRTLVGWTLKEDEVVAHGDHVADTWIALGQYVVEEDRGRTQRTWLVGSHTGRTALVLQFSFAGASFPELLPPGAALPGTLAFWPSAYPQRALVHKRFGAPARMEGPLPGTPTFEAFLTQVAAALARQPWLDRFPCVLNGVIPIPSPDSPWSIVDRTGVALPLRSGDHWKLLALSGGAALDLAAEWDGGFLLPLGAVVDGAYHVLCEAA